MMIQNSDYFNFILFSTVSSGINALATVTVEDFVKPHFKLSEGDLSSVSMGMSKFA